MLSAMDAMGGLWRLRVLSGGLALSAGVLLFSSWRTLEMIDAQIRSLQDKCQDASLVRAPGRQPQECGGNFRSWASVPEPNVGGEIGRAQLTRDRLASGQPLALGIFAACALPWTWYLVLGPNRESSKPSD